MLLVKLFWLLTLCTCGYAVIFGGRDARWASGLFLAAALLTIPAMRMDKSWNNTQIPVMLVDSLHFMAMYVVAMRARTYWPLWMTGYLLITIVTHVATLITPAYVPKLYEAMATFWAIPALLSMAIGVSVDRRAGITRRRVNDRDAPGTAKG